MVCSLSAPISGLGGHETKTSMVSVSISGWLCGFGWNLRTPHGKKEPYYHVGHTIFLFQVHWGRSQGSSVPETHTHINLRLPTTHVGSYLSKCLQMTLTFFRCKQQRRGPHNGSAVGIGLWVASQKPYPCQQVDRTGEKLKNGI